MLGLPKLLLLIVIGGAIWFVWRAIQRRGVSGIVRPSQGGQPKALDMEKCRICGDFVPAEQRACANPRCPYPEG